MALIVCIHDVSPAAQSETQVLLDALRPVVGEKITLAVVPQPRGRDWSEFPEADSFVRLIKSRSHEILLHGLTHCRAPNLNPFSALVGWSDEFAGCSLAEAELKLRTGRTTLERLFSQQITGVIPPAWCKGRIGEAIFTDVEHPDRFLVGMSAVRFTRKVAVPLATWSWDAGRVACLGRVLGGWGTILSVRRDAVPCIALHPADITRGYLPRAIALIRRLLASGHQPATFRSLDPRTR